MKTIIISTALLLLFISGNGQQNTQFNQYIFNELIINPAYAGTKQVLNLNASYSTQWTGFPGAPTTQTVSIEGPVSKSIGLGLHFVNDKLGAQSQQGLFGSYSYKINLSEKMKLSFGVAAGASFFTLDGTMLTLENPNDPEIPQTLVRSLRFDSKAGLFLYGERFYAGFSVSDLLADVFKSKDLQVTKQIRHYYLTAGYIFDLGQNFKLKPSFLLKEDFRSPTTFDINSFLMFRELFWVGASVRLGATIFNNDLDNTLRNRNALIFMTNWSITDRFRIGYAYTHTLTALQQFSGHELQLGYYFRTKVTPPMLTPRFF
jgi:type IX secretion system PorP/SprF family membrane protein